MAVKRIDELKPVYLIFGKEELLLEHAIRRLRERVAEVADLDFNFIAFEGETADPEDIVAVANTLPFDSDRRLIVVRSVDRMRAAQQAVLAAYAEAPASTACLVLVATAMPRSSRLYRAVDALGGVAEYKPPRRAEYPAWVTDAIAAKGRRITRDGAEALVRAAGRDLRRLEQEADKVIAYAGERMELDRSDVESVIAGTAPASVFDFLDALGGRDCARALDVLDDLLASGEQLLGIHAMTVRHLRTLASVRALVARGDARPAIGREMGLEDWRARNAIQQADRFDAGELARALRGAADLEARLKSGQGEPRLLFEMWLLDVCRRSD